MGVAITGAATAAPALTWQQALVGLYLVNDWRRVPRPPSPDWFRRHGVLTGLAAGTTRRCAIRLARSRTCVGCGSEASENSEGDHIVPVSRGGPPGAENYIPMCKRCNSSKGTRDLLEWWHLKGKSAADLPVDVLMAYSRLMLPRLSYERSLASPAPDGVVAIFKELAAPLGDEHRRALWTRIQWVVGVTL
jgi:hypothetical protein